MKAIRYHKFGTPDVLRVEEIEDLLVKDDQVLVEVYSTSVNSGDYHLRSGRPILARIFAGPWVPKQKILGTTYSGKVIKVGRNITKFEIGDAVIGSLGIKSGSYAENVVVDENSIIVKKPLELTHEESASLIFGALTAKYFLDKAGIQDGMKVLIIGASGAVGAYAVQYANYLGTYVTGICGPETITFVKSIGASEIIDYTKDNLINYKQKYDIIFDTVGKEKLSTLKKHLTSEGIYMTTAARLDVIISQVFNKKRYKFDLVKSNATNLKELVDLASTGLIRPLIDSIYKMDEIVDAHYHLEEKRKQGTIVLNIKV